MAVTLIAGEPAMLSASRSPAVQRSWLLQAPPGIRKCLEPTLITDFGVHSCYKQFQLLGGASNNLFHLATKVGIWVLLVISKELFANAISFHSQLGL